MTKTKKMTVAKKVIKSIEQAEVEFATFIKKVKEEYDNAEIEIVVKSEI